MILKENIFYKITIIFTNLQSNYSPIPKFNNFPFLSIYSSTQQKEQQIFN